MFRKPEPETSKSPVSISPSGDRQPEASTPAAPAQDAKPSVLGASLHVKGDITGVEDLLVEGFVEGGINLPQNVVTIGRGGRVQATIQARTIHIEGEVHGDLVAGETVIVHRTGSVRGNITAPRVTLEDGARLKGAIDTDSSTTTVKPASSSNSKSDNSPKRADPPSSSNSTASAAV